MKNIHCQMNFLTMGRKTQLNRPTSQNNTNFLTEASCRRTSLMKRNINRNLQKQFSALYMKIKKYKPRFIGIITRPNSLSAK